MFVGMLSVIYNENFCVHEYTTVHNFRIRIRKSNNMSGPNLRDINSTFQEIEQTSRESVALLRPASK